jgi:branched-subunit amino acid transport protein
VSWPAVLTLAAGSYALKALGLVALRGRRLPRRLDDALGVLPAALFAALVVESTIGAERTLVLDARIAGAAAAMVALWLRAGFVVVVMAAASATALARALT